MRHRAAVMHCYKHRPAHCVRQGQQIGDALLER
jgi:hypothetical protein